MTPYIQTSTPASMQNSRVMPDKQRQERVQEYKASSETNVPNDSPQTPKHVSVGRDGQEQHRSDRADDSKHQQQGLAEPAVIRCSRHGHDDKGLEQDAQAERVHGEAGRVDLEADEVENALVVGMLAAIVAGVEGRQRYFRNADFRLA